MGLERRSPRTPPRARRRMPVSGLWTQMLPAMVGALMTIVGGSGCGEERFDPPSREDRVLEAEHLYSPALFDSLAWESDEVRALEGNVVYASNCRDCHGMMGEGGTPYAEQRHLDVPSLVDREWELAEDLAETRHRVFVGHPDGLPTWGVAGLSPREIDAVSYYLLKVLRPEVLDG